MKYSITIAIATLLLSTTMAFAEDCPKGAASCKIVTMTPEEVNTLTQSGGIFDQALWANRSGMTAIIEAWKKKIEGSPQGVVKSEERAK